MFHIGKNNIIIYSMQMILQGLWLNFKIILLNCMQKIKSNIYSSWKGREEAFNNQWLFFFCSGKYHWVLLLHYPSQKLIYTKKLQSYNIANTENFQGKGKVFILHCCFIALFIALFV